MQGFPTLPRRVVIEAEAFRPATIHTKGNGTSTKGKGPNKRGTLSATPASIEKRKATMMATYGTLNVTEVKRIREQRARDAAAVAQQNGDSASRNAKENGTGSIKANSGSHAVS